MNTPEILVLPARPRTTCSASLPAGWQTQTLQRYVIEVCDALARACMVQVGAVLPEATVIADHFRPFTVEQARSFSTVLHRFYGACLPANAPR